MQKRIHQGAAIALGVRSPCASVDHHACSFVDDGEVVVFIDNVQRNVLRHCPQWRLPYLSQHSDAFSAMQTKRGLGGNVVDQHLLFRD